MTERRADRRRRGGAGGGDSSAAAARSSSRSSSPSSSRSSPSPASSAPLGPEDLAAALDGKIATVEVSLPYRAGLALVAVMMVLLPLVYVAIIGLAAWGVWWHAGMLSGRGGGGGSPRGWLFGYAAPIVVGVVVVLFMIKPLFARPARREKPLSLSPRREPGLFAFVGRLAEIVGAPAPREVNVDCDVNASAGFRRGMASFFSSDLALTIGLPLVAGLDLRQLAGVLAHELGHFAQGTGMRLTYVIRTVDAWFWRVVYERDAWDERLERWAKAIDLRIGVVLHLARLMVWLTRRVLWVLMMCGHAISSFMLRQMEIDADRYAARVAGAAAFRETSRRLPLLSIAGRAAYRDLQRSWSEKRLADDFPALVLANVVQMPEEVKREVLKGTRSETTGLFDSHPSTPERIRSAERDGSDGIFRLEGPATRLFSDFTALSRAASLVHYHALVGEELHPDNLTPTASLVGEQAEVAQGIESCLRYLQGCLDDDDPLPLDELAAAPEDEEAAVGALRDLRAKFDGAACEARPLYKKLSAEKRRGVALDLARALERSKLRYDPATLGLRRDDKGKISARLEECEARRSALREKLHPVRALLARRLSTALGLSRVGRGAAARDGMGLGERDLDRLLAAHAALRDPELRGPLNGLFHTGTVNDLLLENIDADAPESNPALWATFQAGMRAWRKQLAALHAALDPVDYPFEHADGDISIGRYLMEKPPASGDPNLLFPMANAAREKIRLLGGKLKARLATLAERIEAELAGLEPAPPPRGD